MIRIIKGVFGYNNGKSVIPKTAQDGPFECDKAIEKRLVSLGVAEYVTKVVKANETVEAAEAAEIIEEPSREDLIATFKNLGLKGNPSTMKTETLKAKISEAAELVEDEDSPSFDGVDGVEG